MGILTIAATTYLADDGPWEGAGDGWWWLIRPLMLLVWIVVIALVVRWVLRTTGRGGPSGVERARGILAERYARGELNAAEYRERLEQLR